MARVGYAAVESEVADRIRERRGGALTPLDGMLLHNPSVADGWNSLLGAIRGHSSVPAALRELAILRVARLNGAEYEWLAHEPIARAAGLTSPQVDAIRDVASGDAGPLTAEQRVVLAYTDVMTRQVAVPDAVFKALAGHLDERQIVELTATIAAYNMVSRFLVALGLDAAERDLIVDRPA